MACGVAFGAIGSTPSATLSRARSLTIGIGLQNLPEGLAVSLPLYRAGMTAPRAFFYGQISGMVEPLGAILGAVAVQTMTPALPYAMAFAAGAMIFIVIDDMVPEAQASTNAKMSSWGAVAGFTVRISSIEYSSASI